MNANIYRKDSGEYINMSGAQWWIMGFKPCPLASSGRYSVPWLNQFTDRNMPLQQHFNRDSKWGSRTERLAPVGYIIEFTDGYATVRYWFMPDGITRCISKGKYSIHMMKGAPDEIIA